jgi:sodium/bile acid cotransporter 2
MGARNEETEILAKQIASNVLLFFLVFGLAVTVDPIAFKKRFKKPLPLCIGLICQFLILPLLGFVSCKVFFKNEPLYGIPLIATASSPGGSYSNWWCSIFNADLPLSMAMTTSSSLLSALTLPANILLYTELAFPKETQVKLSWDGLFTTISLVIVGIFSGLFVGKTYPRHTQKLNALGNACGVALVLMGFFLSSNSSAPIWDRDWKFYVGVTLPCVLGLMISLATARVCRLKRPSCLAVAIEVCYQNTAIPLAVILNSFSDDPKYCNGGEEGTDEKMCDAVGLALGVPTYYQTVQIFSLAVCCLCCWKGGWTLAPKDESFFNVIGKNYQVAEKEDDGEEDENDEEAMRSRRRSTRRSDFATAANTTTDNNTSSSADLEDPYAIDVRSYRLSSKGSEMVAIALEDDKNEDIDAPVADDR